MNPVQTQEFVVGDKVYMDGSSDMIWLVTGVTYSADSSIVDSKYRVRVTCEKTGPVVVDAFRLKKS